MTLVTLIGDMTVVIFHKMSYWLKMLNENQPHVKIEILSYFKSEQKEEVMKLKTLAKEDEDAFIHSQNEDILVSVDGLMLGGQAAASQQFLLTFNFLCKETPEQEIMFKDIATAYMNNRIYKDPAHKQCFFKFKQADKYQDIVFRLYNKVCPKSVQNFIELCKGYFDDNDTKLGQKNSIVHRIVKDAYIQGGDIESKRGDGGKSIQGPKFESESQELRHTERGWVGQANTGEHTNGSQWQITLRGLPYLDQKYVLFGNIAEGKEFLDEVSTTELVGEKPKDDIEVIDCGQGWPKEIAY